ncbi:hypothetical protein O181_019266 [Austropuccinia psidii MF-1]|uniref:Uncharacterized protein n=1 Tax=Austropuccinia psidii MF-1 TaxID=1389203 RepID=A0A9Q3C6U1_9BASI|nr:hypothetical protein [Austropuccinia psidii MF-1]
MHRIFLFPLITVALQAVYALSSNEASLGSSTRPNFLTRRHQSSTEQNPIRRKGEAGSPFPTYYNKMPMLPLHSNPVDPRGPKPDCDPDLNGKCGGSQDDKDMSENDFKTMRKQLCAQAKQIKDLSDRVDKLEGKSSYSSGRYNNYNGWSHLHPVLDEPAPPVRPQT